MNQTLPSAAGDTALPKSGEIVAGKYRIDALIGQGGMGVVLAASDTSLGRSIAVKFLAPAKADRDGAVQRSHGSSSAGPPYMVRARLRSFFMDDASVFERFLSLAKRELAAEDVRLLAHGEPPPSAGNVVVARLPDGRHVVATFAETPKDGEALGRRLAILAGTFAEALSTPPSERTRARPPILSSLHEELKALAVRARARDVVVIDGDSPVVWGCASVPARPRTRSELHLREVSDHELSAKVEQSGPLQDLVPPLESSPMASSADEAEDEPAITRRAIAAIRRLPAIEHLNKGRHMRHVSRGQPAYLVLSFSGIYLLCLVFDGDFDELRAERAAHESLPRIERLVLALPPLDPDPQPMGGVIAFRRARRR